MFNPFIHSQPPTDFLLFINSSLASSFAAVIITTAARGCCLTTNDNIGCYRLLALSYDLRGCLSVDVLNEFMCV